MLMLDQIPRMCEELATCTLEENRVVILKKICDECTSVIRKRCSLNIRCFVVNSSESAMKYYDIATKARAFAKRAEKLNRDDYQASVIAFYANVLAQKSLLLVDYYRKRETGSNE